MERKLHIRELIEFDAPTEESVVREGSGAVRIKGVKLLGTESRNVNRDGTRNRYPADRMAKWAPRYEGVPVYADHSRDDEPRSIRDKLGKVHNVVAKESGLYGDLLLAPGPDADRAEWAAKECPDFLSMSHHASGLAVQEGENPEWTDIQDIEVAYSVDMVVAGGTTNSLYEDDRSATVSDPTTPADEAPAPALAPATAEVVEAAVEADKASDELQAKVSELEEALAALKADKERMEREAARHSMLAESKIPADKQSETFVEAVLTADSDEKAKALIEDRKKLVFHQEPAGAPATTTVTEGQDPHSPSNFIKWIEG